MFFRLFSRKSKAHAASTSTSTPTSNPGKSKAADATDGKEVPAQTEAKEDPKATDGAVREDQMYVPTFPQGRLAMQNTKVSIQRRSLPPRHNRKPRTLHRLCQIRHPFDLLQNLNRLQHVPRKHPLWSNCLSRPPSSR